MSAAGLPSCQGGLRPSGGSGAWPARGDSGFARHSPRGRWCPWKQELEGAFTPPAGTLFSIFCPSLPSPSRLLLFLRLALNTSPLIPTIPHGDSPFQRMAWIPANAGVRSGRAVVQNIPCQGKMRGFLPLGGPEPPHWGSFVGN